MLLWDGACQVHELFSLEKILKLKVKNPDSAFIAHPECETDVLDNADFIGSTSELLKYTQSSDKSSFIVATETGILHQMEKASPQKTFIPAPPDNSCACNDCPHMKLNTLEKLFLCLYRENPEIIMDEGLRKKALQPIKKMLDMSSVLSL